MNPNRNRAASALPSIARSLMALLFALLLGAAIAQDAQDQDATQVDPEATVIEIGSDEAITYEAFDAEFDRAMRSLAAQQGIPYTAETQELFDEFRGDFLNQYATQQALLLEAEERGISVSDEELDEQIEVAREGAGGDEAFEQALAEFGYDSTDDYREAAREGLMAQRVVDELDAEIELSDVDVEEWYEGNSDRFEGEPLENVRSEAESQLRAETLEERFEQLRNDYAIQTYPERLGTGAGDDGISQDDFDTEEGAEGADDGMSDDADADGAADETTDDDGSDDTE